MKAVKRYFKENIGILAALLVMIAFLCIYPRTSTTFPTKTNIFNVLRQSAPNVILSCGMTMAILLGGIDLSVGAIIAMSGCLGAGAVVSCPAACSACSTASLSPRPPSRPSS